MKIVVNTPAGNIGRVVTDVLIAAGHQVTIISRHPAKVGGLVNRGAILVEGSIDNPTVLQQAFKGADAVFWLTPFAFDQPQYIRWAESLADAAAAAAKSASVKRIVLISSVGAQHKWGVGPIGCLPAIENALRHAAPSVTSLRAASFMENFFQSLGSIAASGTIYGPHLANKKMPMVATRDIAKRAAEVLQDSSAHGFRVVGVHGPEDLDQVQAAEQIGRGIGRDVRYIEVTVD